MNKCKKVIDEEDGPENVRIVVGGDIFHQKISQYQIQANKHLKDSTMQE